MGRGRPKKHALNFLKQSLGVPNRSNPATFKSITLIREPDGRVATSSSFVPVCKKKSELEPQVSNNYEEIPMGIEWNDTPVLDEVALDPAYVEHIANLTLEPAKRKRTPADEPLRTWVPHCDKFLEEMMNLEGRGIHCSDRCSRCQRESSESLFECSDCLGRHLLCAKCTVSVHAENPAHRIKKWNGAFYERSNLKALGFRIQLGHPMGEKCLRPEQCLNDDFVLVDIHGVLSVGVDFCGCGFSGERHTTQLLQSRFFPATVDNPKTAATFRLLEMFEVLSYESKVSAFEFYQTLARLSDNTGMKTPKDRYPSLLRMIHQWRHLKILKRAGRGHDPEGRTGTRRGECAVLCPACPHPGKNLPEGWRDAPDDKRYLYSLFLGMDANFRLKRKNVSSQSCDPGLGQGIAYFVEETDYKKHLEVYMNESEPKSNCSRHAAVYLSDAKPGRGHAATGVGSVECVRHGMWRPNAVGDLQKGERYCNMDYLFYNTLQHSKLNSLVISYDIACQWSINLKERMSKLDDTFLRADNRIHVKYLVPKFHLPAHVERCRTRFSFNFTKGVGRTDGEGVERGWAEVNPLASSTREMGPGSRRDTLDSHFGDSNWRKVTRLGISLHRKLVMAAGDMVDHVLAHRELEASLPPASIAVWTSEVENWEKDQSLPNPFEIQVETPTQAAVRRELSEAEGRDILTGRELSLHDTISPSVLIASGLELENMQRSLQVAKREVWDHAQDCQRTRVQLRDNALQRKIEAWSQVQQLYIPGVVALRKRDNEMAATDLPTHTIPLWLPSQIEDQVPYDIRLAEIEWQLRLAQAYEALESLRQSLQIRAYLFKFKDRFVWGQSANTRARNAINNVQTRIDGAGEEYRSARLALVSLGGLLGKIGWQDKLLPLAESDKRDLTQAEDGVSEGRRKLSWIWKTLGVVGCEDDTVLQDTLRVEWCKSRARAARFTEEVELLKEEMERVLRFLVWQEIDWLSRQAKDWPGSISKVKREGLMAYAARQANLRKELREHFAHLWRHLPAYITLMKKHIEEPDKVPYPEVML